MKKVDRGGNKELVIYITIIIVLLIAIASVLAFAFMITPTETKKPVAQSVPSPSTPPTPVVPTNTLPLLETVPKDGVKASSGGMLTAGNDKKHLVLNNKTVLTLPDNWEFKEEHKPDFLEMSKPEEFSYLVDATSKEGMVSVYVFKDLLHSRFLENAKFEKKEISSTLVAGMVTLEIDGKTQQVLALVYDDNSGVLLTGDFNKLKIS